VPAGTRFSLRLWHHATVDIELVIIHEPALIVPKAIGAEGCGRVIVSQGHRSLLHEQQDASTRESTALPLTFIRNIENRRSIRDDTYGNSLEKSDSFPGSNNDTHQDKDAAEDMHSMNRFPQE
jgi:hypothetical protein